MVSINRELIILGGGGHGGVVFSTLRALKICPKAYIAPEESQYGWAKELDWLGGEEVLETIDSDYVELLNGIGSVSRTELRSKVFIQARSNGFSFKTICHPFSFVEKGTVIGQGTQVMAGAVIQTGVEVGMNCLINTGTIIEHNCRVGDHVHIAPGVTISGEVCIGEGAHVGTGSVIRQGITIGKNAIIGAGAVVVASVEEGETVFGVPAKPTSLKSKKCE